MADLFYSKAWEQNAGGALTDFRYTDAPSRFSKKAGNAHMELADIQKLVDWKL